MSDLHAKYPQHVRLAVGADVKQRDEFERVFSCSIESVNPTWRDVLDFSNGVRVLRYSIYPISAQSIHTVTFQTLFLWDINPAWRERLFLFMGGGDLLEFGIRRTYLGGPCIFVMSGYDATEAIPIGSQVDAFLTALLEQTAAVLQHPAEPTTSLPSLAGWPPSLEAWYSLDAPLVQRLSRISRAELHQENPQFADRIIAACRAVGERR